MTNHPNRSKGRSHEVVVHVRFDKPCTKADAAKAFRDCVFGEFYPTPFKENGPETFRVVGARPLTNGDRS